MSDYLEVIGVERLQCSLDVRNYLSCAYIIYQSIQEKK